MQKGVFGPPQTHMELRAYCPFGNTTETRYLMESGVYISLLVQTTIECLNIF